MVPGMAQTQVTACSHNTASLKCIHYATPCSIEKLSENGKYSASKIISKQPSYEKAINQGITYFTVDYEVEVEWPSYPDLVIEASNVSNGLAKADTPVQLMFKINKLAKGYEEQGLKPDYSAIQTKILRTKPLYADDVPQLIKYVDLWSGGSDNPIFLLAIQNYVRTLDCVHPIRRSVLKPITEADLGYKQGGRLRAAGVKAIAKYGEFLTTSHLNSLGMKKRDIAIKAEQRMLEWASTVEGLDFGLDKAIIDSFIGEHEIQLFFYVTNASKNTAQSMTFPVALFRTSTIMLPSTAATDAQIHINLPQRQRRLPRRQSHKRMSGVSGFARCL